MPITLTKFIDLLKQESENIEGKMTLERYLEVNQRQLYFQSVQNKPLNVLELKFLIGAVADLFRQRIAGICTDELYEMVIKEDRAFLEEIAQKAVEQGVTGIDMDWVRGIPLTFSEAMAIIPKDS